MKEQTEKRLFLTLTHFGGENETGDIEEGIAADAERGDADRRITGATLEREEKESAEREFEELIKGRFEAAFSSRVQKIIDKRFKQTKLLEEQVKENSQFMERLSSLCGGDSPEAEVLLERVSALVSAREALLSPEKAADMERQARSLYPDFDMKREMESEGFRKYTERGLDFTEAYVLTHLEDIKRDAAREGARQAVRSIGSMGHRPAEGEQGSASPPARRRMADLDSSEIKRLIERASKGEKIRFKDI